MTAYVWAISPYVYRGRRGLFGGSEPFKGEEGVYRGSEPFKGQIYIYMYMYIMMYDTVQAYIITPKSP